MTLEQYKKIYNEWIKEISNKDKNKKRSDELRKRVEKAYDMWYFQNRSKE